MCRNEVRRQGNFFLFQYIDFPSENQRDYDWRPRDELKHFLVEKKISSWWGKTRVGIGLCLFHASHQRIVN